MTKRLKNPPPRGQFHYQQKTHPSLPPTTCLSKQKTARASSLAKGWMHVHHESKTDGVGHNYYVYKSKTNEKRFAERLRDLWAEFGQRRWPTLTLGSDLNGGSRTMITIHEQGDIKIKGNTYKHNQTVPFLFRAGRINYPHRVASFE